jgi:hypothetical protein
MISRRARRTGAFGFRGSAGAEPISEQELQMKSSSHSRTSSLIVPLMLAAAIVAAPLSALAQVAGVPIEPRRLPANDKTLLAKLAALRDDGKLMSMNEVREALAAPTPAPVTLSEPSTERLAPAEIAARGRKSLLRVGWYYLCHRCSNWHVLSAGGYALTPDGLAVSCYHVLEPNDSTMREGYLFAMDPEGGVFPITSVLAADEKLDAAIFQMEGSGFVPVALSDQNAPGDSVFLVSDPRGVAGYFSVGQINRFYWNGDKKDGNLESLEAVRSLRIDVSTSWAPGSSGAAILDVCGNAIGHVTKIAVEREPTPPNRPAPPAAANDEDKAPSTNPTTQPEMPQTGGSYLLVLYEAVPARGVRLLVESTNAAARTQPSQ